MIITIPAAYDGRILRSYLKLTLGLSTAVLSGLKNHERGILVNGQRVTVRYVLKEGDVLELFDRDTPDTATETVIPCEHPLTVLYEDPHVIALQKPAGMPTHPSHGHLTDTLANALAYRYAQADEPFVFRPLGRLDRNTSGVVVAGKTRAASGFLGRALKEGRVTKRYIAILDGEMDFCGTDCDTVHTVNAPIYRPDDTGIRRAVGTVEENGAVSALTRFRVLAVGGGYTLVLCEPVTGRTHQLRVHFSHLGFPIAGDEIYGKASPSLDRHALHALSLSVPLPFSEAENDGADSLPPSLDAPLNRPTADGMLHTWAPLPSELRELVRCAFPESPLLTASPTRRDLAALSLPATESRHSFPAP